LFFLALNLKEATDFSGLTEVILDKNILFAIIGQFSRTVCVAFQEDRLTFRSAMILQICDDILLFAAPIAKKSFCPFCPVHQSPLLSNLFRFQQNVPPTPTQIAESPQHSWGFTFVITKFQVKIIFTSY